MQKQEEKKQVYALLILRIDGEHISVAETDVYDKAYEQWIDLTNKWEDAVTNKKPFRLTAPIVTAFDPGLIKEIAIRPVLAVESSKYQNPYQQEMMKNGLSSMLNNRGGTANSEILDGGYR